MTTLLTCIAYLFVNSSEGEAKSKGQICTRMKVQADTAKKQPECIPQLPDIGLLCEFWNFLLRNLSARQLHEEELLPGDSKTAADELQGRGLFEASSDQIGSLSESWFNHNGIHIA